MHDKNGKEIKVGDFVKVPAQSWDGNVTRVGQVTALSPGATSCNVTANVMVPSVVVSPRTLNAADLEVVD